MITCFLRYTINPEKLVEFEHYAAVWVSLIEKYGGTHHGYFVPGDAPPLAEFGQRRRRAIQFSHRRSI